MANAHVYRMTGEILITPKKMNPKSVNLLLGFIYISTCERIFVRS